MAPYKLVNKWFCSRFIFWITDALPTAKATRQPAILKVVDLVYNTIPNTFAPGVDKKLGCLTPSKPIAPYAKSCTTKTLCFLATSTVSSKKSSEATAAVGLFG